jgi:hypothetical protein
MIRRNFLSIAVVILGICAIGLLSFKFSFLRKIFYKIKNRISPPSGLKPDDERGDATLSKEGISTSVETALNSRCTSDYDDNPRLFHWGMFDKSKKLTTQQIEKIKACAKIPRFTDIGIEIRNEKKILTFTIDNHVTAPFRDWVMVESGMQQQAIGLVCAALGAGYVFITLGVNGKLIEDDKFATVRMKLDALKPSYNGAYWSVTAPLELKPWKRGTLPDPIRQGAKPLLTALEGLKKANENGRQISANDLGQLLWAARGRTPHYFKSDPWGMTIPTYQGENDMSEVFLVGDGKISKYINWLDNRPTNSLERVGITNAASENILESQYRPNNYFIVLNKNKDMASSLWEIGYQLLNLLVQAFALDISYQAVLLDENQKEIFKKIGINNPVALLAL